MDAAIGAKREELAIAGHEVLGPRHDSTFEYPIVGRVRDDRESRRAGVDHPHGQSGNGDGDAAANPAKLRSGKGGRYLVREAAWTAGDGP